MTSRVTVVVLVVLPLLAEMVMVWLPRLERLPTFTVIVEVPDPVMELGLKVTVWPLPCPDADSETAPLKPPVPVTVMVELPDELRATVMEVGLAETL